jgi:hypothetical protein
MAVSKVILNGTTLIDTTDKTVTDSSMLNGITALDSAGMSITGNIATKSSSNMTVSGATVTAPAGYYATNASKTVASGSATIPATTITANPSISVSNNGLITATASATKSVTPTVSAGYVSSGTAGTITVSGSNTSQLTVYAGANHSSGYTITVSLTNPVHPEQFGTVEVWEGDTVGDYLSLTLLYTFASATGSTEVTTSKNILYIYLEGVSFSPGTLTCGGGVSVSQDYGNETWFTLASNGFINYDGNDYDD